MRKRERHSGTTPIVYENSFVLLPGRYRIRYLVRDSGHGPDRGRRRTILGTRISTASNDESDAGSALTLPGTEWLGSGRET
jgi:hypothetical protein